MTHPAPRFAPARLALFALGAFLLLAPLGLDRHSVPRTLLPTEATTWMAAQSVAWDGDLRITRPDAERLAIVYPLSPPLTLQVAVPTADAAPSPAPQLAVSPIGAALAGGAVRLFGVHGPRVLSVLGLLLALLAIDDALRRSRWIGDAQRSDEAASPADAFATVWAVAALVFALAGLYAFTARFDNLALAALAVGVRAALRPTTTSAARSRAAIAGDVGAGVALALALALAPATLAAIVAVAIVLVVRRAGPRLLGITGGALLVGLLTFGLIGPWLDAPSSAGTHALTLSPADARVGGGGDSDHDVLRIDDDALRPLPATAPILRPWSPLIGRHTGLVTYAPALIVLLPLALWTARRQPLRLLLLAAFGVGVVQVWWTVGAGRGDVPGLPALLPLLALPPLALDLRALGPRRGRFEPPLALATLALAAIGMMPAVLHPFGAQISPRDVVHGHARLEPLRHLPLEQGLLHRLAAYDRVAADADAVRVYHPNDAVLLRNDTLWFPADQRVTLWLEWPTPPPDVLQLEVLNLAPDNVIRVQLGGAAETLRFDGPQPPEGTRRLIRLHPARAAIRVPSADDGDDATYRLPLRVHAARAVQPGWRDDNRHGALRNQLIGAALVMLGSDAFLQQPLYAVTWLDCGAPARVATGASFAVPVRLRNDSASTWPTVGATRVRLGYHWSVEGSDAARRTSADRADFDRPVAPGDVRAAWLPVTAPRRPGRYALEVDAVFERVAWFSDRGPSTCRSAIEVIDAAADSDDPAVGSSR